MRRTRDDTIHPVLFDSVTFARSIGFELIDVAEFKEQKKLRDGCHVADGETIAPETAPQSKRRAEPNARPPTADEKLVPGETRYIPFA